MKATSITTSSSSDAIASRMRALSATEWAGLPLSTSIARNRLGWSVRISSGITLQGVRPPIRREPVTGVPLLAPASCWSSDDISSVPAPPSCPTVNGAIIVGRYADPFLPKLPVSSISSL